MIIALLALASAMIVGGLLAAFFGWDIVLVERGWTMVIAGSICAASGALLLGIVAAISKLAQIESRLSMLRGGFAEYRRVEARSSDGDPAGGIGLAGGLAAGQGAAAAEDERPDESQPTLPLFEEGERREQDETTVAIAEWPEERDPAPIIPFPPRTASVHPAPRDEEEPDLKVPDFLLAGRHRDTQDEMRVTDAVLDPDDRQEEDREREARDRDEDDQRLEPAPDLEPAPEPASETEPAADEDDRETAREEEASPDETGTATIIGTYNSGDNKYVMFSDGSIEAQTPSGVFRFQSLDELKEFIAAGGEGNSSASI
jgi:hypothetical protein